MEVLHRPIQLPCNQLICATCCTKSIAVTVTTACPCCYQHDLAESGIRKPPDVVMDLLAGLLVNCKKCQRPVKASIYQQHLDTGCTAHVVLDSPSRHSLREVLNAPADAPATPVEVRAAGHVLQRMLQQGESGNIIRVPTKGKVRTPTHTCTYMYMCVHVHVCTTYM